MTDNGDNIYKINWHYCEFKRLLMMMEMAVISIVICYMTVTSRNRKKKQQFSNAFLMGAYSEYTARRIFICVLPCMRACKFTWEFY
jgi:hypothetical protein